MTQQNPHLTEAYFVSSFLSGLSEDIRPMVKMIRPQSVEQAAESARLQEMTVEALMRKQRQQHKGLSIGPTHGGGKYGSKEIGKSRGGIKQGTGPNTVPYGEQLSEQRRLAGLCFRCGDKYHFGHQCKRQILLLEGGEEEEEVEDSKEEVGEDGESEGEHDGEISLHALKGVTNNKIIKVAGSRKNHGLLILIDSESTHSFLDEGTTKRLKCPLQGTQPLSVTVANGSRLIGKLACNGFTWEM